MRVVLDTNVLVRAAKASDNPARELLDIVSAEPHVLIVSPYLLDEVERALRYPRVQKQHGLNEEEMRAFVANVQGVAAVVELEGAQDAPLSPDPDDDPILQTAAYGQAQALCTRDRLAQPVARPGRLRTPAPTPVIRYFARSFISMNSKPLRVISARKSFSS